jgi:hypothetical protein
MLGGVCLEMKMQRLVWALALGEAFATGTHRDRGVAAIVGIPVLQGRQDVQIWAQSP